MGVIDIRRRTERLGNFGNVPMVRQPSVQTATAGMEAVARGVGDLAKIGIAFAEKVRKQRDEDAFTAIQTDYRSRTNEMALGTDEAPGWLQRNDVDCRNLPDEMESGMAVNLRRSIEAYERENGKVGDDVRRRLASSLAGYNESLMNRAMEKQTRGWVRHRHDADWKDAATAEQSWKSFGGEENYRAWANAAVHAMRNDGKTDDEIKVALKGMAEKQAAEIYVGRARACGTKEERDELESHVMESQQLPADMVALMRMGGEPGSEMSPETREKIMDACRREFRVLDAQAEEAKRVDRENVAADVSKREYEMRDTPREGWAEAYDALGKDENLVRTDPQRAQRYRDHAQRLRDAAKGAEREKVAEDVERREYAIRDMPDEKWAEAYDALGKDENLVRTDPRRAQSYRDQAKALRKAATRDEREKVADDFDRREYAMRDMPDEGWADAYDAMGRDADLVRTDPARATRYRDRAKAIRAEEKVARAKAAAAAAKEERKATQDALSFSLLQMQLEEYNGRLSPAQKAEWQAAIWRKYTVLQTAGALDPAFAESFMGDYRREIAKEDRPAMRVFFQMFGSLCGEGGVQSFEPELDASGSPTASARKAAEKDSTAYYATKAMDGNMSSPRRASAAEILRFGESVYRVMQTLPPGMDRVKWMTDVCERFKTEVDKENFMRDFHLHSKVGLQVAAEFRKDDARKTAAEKARMAEERAKMEKEAKDGGK